MGTSPWLAWQRAGEHCLCPSGLPVGMWCVYCLKMSACVMKMEEEVKKKSGKLSFHNRHSIPTTLHLHLHTKPQLLLVQNDAPWRWPRQQKQEEEEEAAPVSSSSTTTTILLLLLGRAESILVNPGHNYCCCPSSSFPPTAPPPTCGGTATAPAAKEKEGQEGRGGKHGAGSVGHAAR